MPRIARISVLIAPLALAACVVPPAGPSVMALPKQGGDFSQFQGQDANCRGYASAQIGGVTPGQAATDSAVGSAVIGTALGAAAGAAIGSVGGAVEAGAAIGAATGLVAGSAVGANNAQMSAGAMQQHYDIAYTQCMVASGYTVQQPAYAAAPYYGAPGYGYAAPAYAAPAYGYAAPYPYYYAPPVVIGGWGGGYGVWRGGYGGGGYGGWHGGYGGGGWRH